MIPNLRHIVQGVRDSRAWDFSSREALCAYSNAVVVALYEADPNFGHLLKTAAQNHCVDPHGRRHAVDVALYRVTGQIVDFIASAGVGSPNAVTWQVGPEGEYSTSQWLLPVAGTAPTPGTPPPDAPSDLAARFSRLEATVEMDRVRMEAINTRFDRESGANVKHPLPDYAATVFGFTITSKPQP